MKKERYENYEFGFPFISVLSDDLSSNPALIIQLHGAGERGNGGKELDKVLVNGFAKTADLTKMKDCVLVMPQCPTDTFWAARVESIRKFIDKMIELYSADKTRIYLAGLSMGGFGTWYTAMAYPELFAAIAPCCGGGMPWNAGVLNMPVWAFHGALDKIVAPINSIDMVESLMKTNNNVKFDIYGDMGHNSWDRAFSDELLIWLMQQRKSDVR